MLGGAFVSSAGLAAKKPAAKKACVLKKKAKCKKAKLVKVKVGKQNLSGASLAGASITGATFSGTNLTGVDLRGARITNTTFTGAVVTNLDLSQARLSNVRFVGVRASGIGSRSQAREQDCSVTVEPPTSKTDDGSPPLTWFECTGGGVDLSGATLTNVLFRKSNIPGSLFVGTTFLRSGKSDPIFSFIDSQVDRSNFSRSKGARLEGDTDNESRPTKMTVVGSIFDGATGVSLDQVNATNASFGGTTFAFFEVYKTITTGSRGLNGATKVGLAAASGLPDVVRSVIIREDGYWSPGVRCATLPCAYTTAAVGSPGKVIVGSTAPVAVDLPGWACGPATPVGTPVNSWTTTCTVAAIPAAESGGTISAGGTTAETRTVTVSAQDGMLQPLALSSIHIETVTAAGGVTATKACFAQSSCTTSVAKGSLVRITMSNATGQLVGWCSAGGATVTGTAPPNSVLTCPDATVDSDLAASVMVS